MTEQDRFKEVAAALMETGIEGYQDWPIIYLIILYAYEQWNDGAPWQYVRELLKGSYDEKDRRDIIRQLQNYFNYPKGDQK
jgi:hypothetical protein